MDYALLWAGIIAIAVLLYVILDGFDLGVGILFPTLNDSEKDAAMNSIAPIWDGNETWLVLGEAACSPYSRWRTLSLCPRCTPRSSPC